MRISPPRPARSSTTSTTTARWSPCRLDQTGRACSSRNRADAFQIWREPFTELRIPLLFNLRRDPFEKAQIDANVYHDWFLDRPYVIVPMQQIAGKFFATLQEYPPSQTPGSFNLEKVQEQIENAATGK